MNALFIAAMIIVVIFGLGFIFSPGTLLGPMGVTLDANSDALARLFGTAIINFPILLWFARKSDNFQFKRGALITIFCYFLFSGICLLVIELKGLMNSMGWSVVILHLIFVIWCGWYLVRKTE